MKIITKILVVSLIILFSSGHAICTDIPFTVLDRIEWDSWYLFGVDPEGFEALLSKYKDEKYHSIFKQILEKNNQYKEDVVYGVILFCAMLQDKRHLERIKSIHSKSYKYVDVIRFYYFRIGYNKDENLDYLKKEFDALVQNPIDSNSIGFLAFLDDVDLAISYLDKLTPNADGAMAEIVCWTIGHLYFLNRDNVQVISKIKQSHTYKICKHYIPHIK